jgi:hypothetical protein
MVGILATPRAQAVGTCAPLVLNAILIIGFLHLILSYSTDVPMFDTGGFVALGKETNRGAHQPEWRKLLTDITAVRTGNVEAGAS